VAIL
jgi:hypothetical protein